VIERNGQAEMLPHLETIIAENGPLRDVPECDIDG
jgi:hypothetical protein